MGGNEQKRRLSDVVRRAHILAYKEDVDPLAKALGKEGLNPLVQRASYSAEELSYARATRTLINHHMAWKEASQQEGYTLIVESDFVPCVGIGSFPVFWPEEDPLAWGYLYQGSPRLLALVGEEGYLRGHAAPLVAYVVNASVASLFCDFFHSEMTRHDPRQYFTFDADLQWFAMKHGSSAFITFHHYGEHGGLPNPEHASYGLSRAGQHRADNLASRLHFLPQYAGNSRFAYLAVRLHSRLLGLGRLATNRWVADTSVYRNGFWTKARMQAIGIARLL
jgi:hypothetical protein